MDDSVDFRAACLGHSLPEATLRLSLGRVLDAMSRLRKRAGVPLVLNQGAFVRGAHACRAWAAGREEVQA